MCQEKLYKKLFNDCGNNQQILFHTLNRLVGKKQENTLPEGGNQELSENSVDSSMTK